MRSPVSELELIRPRDLDEALATLASGEARPAPLAGGTDLFVYLNAGSWTGRRFLDLSPLRELSGVLVSKQAVTIGALTTFWQIREHAAIRRHLPSLAAAAREVGAWAIQQRATIAGNIANASPAGDSLPVLLAHDARVHVRSLRGARVIAFPELYTGYRQFAIAPDELITAVSIPLPPRGAFPFFRKVGTRLAQSISKVVFCGLLARERDAFSHVRLAYGSVAPTTVRARNAESALLGTRGDGTAESAAVQMLSLDIAPIDDIRSDREYRLAVAANVLAQCLRAEGASRRR